MGALGNLIPLVILFAVVGGIGWVAYQMYLYTNDMATRGKNYMEKKNVSFTKEGMKVGVKDLNTEDYEDKTQSVLVNTWNLGAANSNNRKGTSPRPSPSREDLGKGR